MKIPPIVLNWLSRLVGIQQLRDELIIQKQEFEEEKLHKIRSSGSWTVREPEWLYMIWKCLCGNELVGVFPRKEGFDFTCKCGKHYKGAISGFEQKAKDAFQRCQTKNYQRKTPTGVYLAVCDVITLSTSEQIILLNELMRYFCSESVEEPNEA